MANVSGTVYTLSYAYDPVGNWLSDGEGHVTTYSYAPLSDPSNYVRVQPPYQTNASDMHFDGRGRLFTTYPAQNTVVVEERNRRRNDQLEYLSYVAPSGTEKVYYSADVKTSNWVNSEAERNGGVSAPFTYTYYRFDPNEEITYDNRIDNPSYAITYSYDRGGNRLSQNSLGTLTTYTYLPGNRLSTEQTGTAVTTYSYDQNGNQIGMNVAGALTTNTYDAENRLSGVQNPDGSAESLLYSANGPRKQKSVTAAGGPTTTTHFVYDDANLHQERDNNGLIIAQYTWKPEGANMNAGAVWRPGSGGDSLLSQRRASVPGDLADGTTSFFAFDILGRVRALFDINNNITDMWVWHAFGTLFTRTGGTVTPFGYGGKWGYYTDSLRRLNVGWRVFDPVTGRWTAVDPIRFKGGDSNAYRYVKNNPARWVDPDGRDPVDAALIGCAVGVGISLGFSVFYGTDLKTAACKGFFSCILGLFSGLLVELIVEFPALGVALAGCGIGAVGSVLGSELDYICDRHFCSEAPTPPSASPGCTALNFIGGCVTGGISGYLAGDEVESMSPQEQQALAGVLATIMTALGNACPSIPTALSN